MLTMKITEQRQPRGMPYEREIERSLTFCYSKRNGLQVFCTDDSNSNTRSRARYPDDEKKIAVKFDYIKDQEDFLQDPSRDRNRGNRNRNRNRNRDSNISDYDSRSMDRRSSRGNESRRIRDVGRSQNLIQYHDEPVSYDYNQNQHYDQIQDIHPGGRDNVIALEPINHNVEPIQYLQPINEDHHSGFRGRDYIPVAEPIDYTADSAHQAYPLLPIEDRNNRSPDREHAFTAEPDSYLHDISYQPYPQPGIEGRGGLSRANTYPPLPPPQKQVRFSKDVERYPNTSRRRSSRNDDERPSPGRRRSTR